MLIYALVATAGIGAVFVSGMLIRSAFNRSKRSGVTSIAIGVYALAALAGSIKFCYDLVAERQLWTDGSTAIAFLNFVGLLMINYYYLLPVVVGCGALYLASLSGTGKRKNGEEGGVEKSFKSA